MDPVYSFSTSLQNKDYVGALNRYSKLSQRFLQSFYLLNKNNDDTDILSLIQGGDTNAHSIIMHNLLTLIYKSNTPKALIIKYPILDTNDLSCLKTIQQKLNSEHADFLFIPPSFNKLFNKVITLSGSDIQKDIWISEWATIYEHILNQYPKFNNNTIMFETFWFRQLELIVELYRALKRKHSNCMQCEQYKSKIHNQTIEYFADMEEYERTLKELQSLREQLDSPEDNSDAQRREELNIFNEKLMKMDSEKKVLVEELRNVLDENEKFKQQYEQISQSQRKIQQAETKHDEDVEALKDRDDEITRLHQVLKDRDDEINRLHQEGTQVLKERDDEIFRLRALNESINTKFSQMWETKTREVEDENKKKITQMDETSRKTYKQMEETLQAEATRAKKRSHRLEEKLDDQKKIGDDYYEEIQKQKRIVDTVNKDIARLKLEYDADLARMKLEYKTLQNIDTEQKLEISRLRYKLANQEHLSLEERSELEQQMNRQHKLDIKSVENHNVKSIEDMTQIHNENEALRRNIQILKKENDDIEHLHKKDLHSLKANIDILDNQCLANKQLNIDVANCREKLKLCHKENENLKELLENTQQKYQALKITHNRKNLDKDDDDFSGMEITQQTEATTRDEIINEIYSGTGLVFQQNKTIFDNITEIIDERKRLQREIFALEKLLQKYMYDIPANTSLHDVVYKALTISQEILNNVRLQVAGVVEHSNQQEIPEIVTNLIHIINTQMTEMVELRKKIKEGEIFERNLVTIVGKGYTDRKQILKQVKGLKETVAELMKSKIKTEAADDTTREIEKITREIGNRMDDGYAIQVDEGATIIDIVYNLNQAVRKQSDETKKLQRKYKKKTADEIKQVQNRVGKTLPDNKSNATIIEIVDSLCQTILEMKGKEEEEEKKKKKEKEEKEKEDEKKKEKKKEKEGCTTTNEIKHALLRIGGTGVTFSDESQLTIANIVDGLSEAIREKDKQQEKAKTLIKKQNHELQNTREFEKKLLENLNIINKVKKKSSSSSSSETTRDEIEWNVESLLKVLQSMSPPLSTGPKTQQLISAASPRSSKITMSLSKKRNLDSEVSDSKQRKKIIT